MRAIILTALEAEYLAVLAHLNDPKEYTYKGTIYQVGRYYGNGRTWDIAIAEIGPHIQNASREAERAINYFHPKVAIFMGVAGGLKPKDLAIGDVVAATKVYGYESGKAEFKTLARPEVYRSSYGLEQRARAVIRENAWINRIKPMAPDSFPKALVGPIAAGAKVVASTRSSIYKFIISNYNDALAVEMEGLGFLSAANANSDVDALVVRGISDMIDNKDEDDAKGDQIVASRNAAAFAFEVLANYGPLDTPAGLFQDLQPGLLLPSLCDVVPAGQKSDLLNSVDGLAKGLTGTLVRTGKSGRPRRGRPR